jgi:choline dehydrogenase-like flavoprotein
MLLDVSELELGAVLTADLCIVGGGPAGISIARALGSSRLQVVVLESGGLEVDGETQHLYSGPCRGTLLEGLSGYLATSRLRLLGGTSNHWQGWCRRHDPLDYEVRDRDLVGRYFMDHPSVHLGQVAIPYWRPLARVAALLALSLGDEPSPAFSSGAPRGASFPLGHSSSSSAAPSRASGGPRSSASRSRARARGCRARWRGGLIFLVLKIQDPFIVE